MEEKSTKIKGDKEPRTGEKNEARKSEPARELLIREVSSRHFTCVRQLSNRSEANVNKDDSSQRTARTWRRQTSWMARLVNFQLLTSGNIFLIPNHVQQNFHSCTRTATFEKQRILKAKETCENQFDNNKANNLFAARRNISQRCERKMKVVSQKDDKNKLITLRSIVFQQY